MIVFCALSFYFSTTSFLHHINLKPLHCSSLLPLLFSLPHLSAMSAHHHPSWTLLNYSGSDIDDDDNNNNHENNNNNNTGYLPPPPPMQAGKKRELETEGKSAGATESSDHDIHIWTERERRKKMRNMFSNLHALLPHLPPKVN